MQRQNVCVPVCGGWRVAVMAVLVWGAPQTYAAETSVSLGDCVACHKNVASQKFIHGPVGVKMCEVCHADEKPSAAKHHTFTLTQPQPELCLSCHEAKRSEVLHSKVKHEAITAVGCTACHDPHGSENRFFLKQKSIDALCFACHEPNTREAVAHPPAKASCILCHDPHGGQNKGLLKSPPPKLCLECHQKMRHKLSGKHVHAPVNTGCPTCHNPHSAPKRYLLPEDHKTALCITCHAEIEKKMKSAKHPHPAIAAAGCVGCHNPHSSNEPKMLHKPSMELCVSCHKDKAESLKMPFLHGPVKLGQCAACHDPHGANNPKILKIRFPEEFYNSYKNGLYALCFNCHEKDIARDAKTVELTNFRNGDQNLHYVHVHSEKGRSCKACHEVHAGDQEKHVRKGVPFGSWLLPIRYVKTLTGGGCTVGCHKPRSYDRRKAVINP